MTVLYLNRWRIIEFYCLSAHFQPSIWWAIASRCWCSTVIVSHPSSDNIIHSIWGNCAFFLIYFVLFFLSVFNFDVHCAAWTRILKYTRISHYSEKITWRKLTFGSFFFGFVCLRVNTVVKVGGDMYKKKLYIAHWDSRGVKAPSRELKSALYHQSSQSKCSVTAKAIKRTAVEIWGNFSKG